MSGPNLYGTDLFGDAIQPPKRGKLADTFLVPPFSVLNAREGWWQERKRGWLALGIKSEVGRGANTLGLSAECEAYRGREGGYAKAANTAYAAADGESWQSGSGSTGKAFRLSRAPAHKGRRPGGGGQVDERTGRPSGEDYAGGDAWLATENDSGTSVFDPVLCELAYRWWCPPGGLVLDPFAGGSVRGVVAALLGRRYWGCDLRSEQIAANREQSSAICPDAPPVWQTGDARDVLTLAPPADFVFSCPPYGDLERYSDDPRDLSTMDYPAFRDALGAIVAAACSRLKPDRFACFVVGDFRDKRGNYRNFVSDTIGAFRAAGLHLYNEAILVTQVGSLPVRVGAQWNASRKLGKTHQNVLVFVKGDGKAAARAVGVETEAARA